MIRNKELSAGFGFWDYLINSDYPSNTVVQAILKIKLDTYIETDGRGAYWKPNPQYFYLA